MVKPSEQSGFFSWLGRQVGHVKKAVSTDVSKPEPKVIYRQDTIEEKPAPDRPGVLLRRTTIDEVIVESAEKKPQNSAGDKENQNH